MIKYKYQALYKMFYVNTNNNEYFHVYYKQSLVRNIFLIKYIK